VGLNNDRGRLRLLLASSSVAAMLVGGGAPAAFAACVTPVGNQASVTNSSPITCLDISGITVTGAVTNTSGGVITPSGTSVPTRTGITINNASVGGVVSNAGTISASGSGNAISVTNNTTLESGIIDSGTILSSNHGIFIGGGSTVTKGGTAIRITGHTFTGGISNAGTVTGGNFGIVLSGVTTFSGGIANSGTISGAAQYGIEITNVGAFLNGITNSSGGLIEGNFFAINIEGGATFSGGITNYGTISGGITAVSVGSLSTFSGGISNAGTISSAGHNAIDVTSVAQFGTSDGGGITNSGTLVGGRGIAVNPTGSSIQFGNASLGGGIVNSGSGKISATFTGILVGGLSTFYGGISNSGTISGGSNGIYLASISSFFGGITNTGTITSRGVGIHIGNVTTFATYAVATFSGNISNSGTIVARTGILINAGTTFVNGAAIVNSGIITDTGGTAIDVSAATSAVTIDQVAGTINGAIKLSPNADVLNISGGTINGNIVGQGSSDTINFALGSGTFTYASPFGFSGINQVNIKSGTVVLNGTNSATNITVSGGTLAGNGTIDPSPSTTVTINSGGILAPGPVGGIGTLTIDGTLVFNANSAYAVQIGVGAGNNSNTAVTGTASLDGNGTVTVTPQLGHYNATYQILTTTGGLTGPFAGLSVNGSFVGGATLDYTTNPGDVDLDINGASLLATPPGASGNQQAVLNGINNGIIASPANTALPPQFQMLGSLSGQPLLNALSQLSGEVATGAQTSAFQSMNEFLNLLLDPSSMGGSEGGGPLGFAPEQASLPPEVALAYASILKAPPPASTAQHWTNWGAAYGGSSLTDGNATLGSNNVTASDYGFAGGMEYHVDPSTLYGFALAGGGTNWNLANALGSGRSDTFQVGVYGKRYFGPAYVSGALAFANNWFTTNRTAFAGDQLTASFDGQSYAARLEAGYRYGLPAPAPGAIVGVTPYAALQTQWFHTPAYSETDLTGGGFGLTYNAMTANDTRSELGARFDDLTVVYGMPLILRGRLAWAHDWVSNPSLDAAFQALPGTSFIVYGAAPPTNSALTTAGAELHINANWSLLTKFDGEFAPTSQTYAGSGTLRYTW
jgi:outer membrane autotransporter protein